MTIIVFLVDTSASMNQRAYLGGRPTMIDVAKGAVESFVKVCVSDKLYCVCIYFHYFKSSAEIKVNRKPL
jgi:hypothetical protein